MSGRLINCTLRDSDSCESPNPFMGLGPTTALEAEQFLLVDDVVAVEDGAALVPGEEHGDPLGDDGN